MRWPDGRWQPSRRRFPTVGGTIVRRTPLRLVFGTYAQRDHYLLDERVDEPAPADWLLGAFLLMRRAMLDWSSAAGTAGSATTARTSTSRTAPRRRGGSAGTCPLRAWSTTTPRSSIAAS